MASFWNSLMFLVAGCSGPVACLILTVYRLYFHPLASVPGPRLAALSSLYEFYYDCMLGGKFIFKLADLHNQYGPIVRIGPHDVHIDDPKYFDQIYNVTSKLDKDGWYYTFVDSPDSAFGTSNADLHRARRKAMSKFFSSSAIANLESASRRNVSLLCERLRQLRKEEKPVNLANAFRCLAADSVTGYCLPEPFHLLDSIDFAEDYNRQSRTLSYIGLWHRHLRVVIPIFMAMPRWFVKMTSSEGGLMMFDFQSDLARQAREAVNAEKRSDNTVLEGIVNSDLPESDKTPYRLLQEARSIVGAGSETTGAALELITFLVLQHPPVKTRLRAELKDFIAGGGDLNSSNAVKRLPYLTAVINEGLRIANNVSGRLPRVDPRNAHTYGPYVLPAGTVINMSLGCLHMNSEAFPEPTRFRPERWLEGDVKALERNFAPFSRGARSCVGKELAVMNMYLMVASFFSQFDAEVFETTYKDIAMEHDFFAPFPHKDSSGLRVILK